MTHLPVILLFTVVFTVCVLIYLTKLFFRKPWHQYRLWLLKRQIDKLARKIL